MKFQPDGLPGTNVITRHESGRVWVGTRSFEHSVLVPWRGEVTAWPPRHAQDLTEQHFEQLLTLGPEVVIFGSGDRLSFVAPALQRALFAKRIGIETMDTAAACRTYNVLVSEGRTVLAALIVPEGPGAPGDL